MKKLITKNLCLIALAFTTGIFVGCASIKTAKYDKESGKLVETSSTFAFAQKSLLKGYKLFNTTAKTSSTVSISTIDNETQTEVITASGEALGNLVGAAAKAAAKP